MAVASSTVKLYGALGLLAVAVGFVAWRALKNGGAGDLGAALGRGAVDAAGGVVLGIGDAVGIPRTNEEQCRKDLANGDRLAASFSCPAGTFLKDVFTGGQKSPEPKPRVQVEIPANSEYEDPDLFPN